jgi:hypothetical protein
MLVGWLTEEGYLPLYVPRQCVTYDADFLAALILVFSNIKFVRSIFPQ